MTQAEPANDSPARPGRRQRGEPWAGGLLKGATWLFGLLLAGLAGLLFLVGLALAVAYPNLPAIDSFTDYRPKLPLRVFSADGVQIGEFGEERRNFVPIALMPQVMKDAVLAAEDARFYEHGGVDYKGVARAPCAGPKPWPRQPRRRIGRHRGRDPTRGSPR